MELFNEREIELLFDAVDKRERHWRSVASRPVQGYGRATELAKKQVRADLAEEYRDLASKMVELTN